MAAQVWKENLPPDYSCSVTSDGRIFFINEATKKSSWLHPVTKIPVQTGHRPLADLPQGWERGVTAEGVPYYIDHVNQQTSLVHPVTGESEVHAHGIHSPSPDSPRLDGVGSTASNSNGVTQDHRKVGSKKSSLGSWVKGPCVKRPEPSTTTLQGWLLKQGSDGLHLWKRRWFVLSDYCLYYYKSPHDDKVLGYIPLPSFKIRPVAPEDRIFRRLSFKAEHENTRTYFFAAETKAQMTQWMNALSLASIMQKDTSFEDKTSSGSSTRRSDHPSISSLASSPCPTSPSVDDSDSGFHGYKSKRFHTTQSSRSPVIFEVPQESNLRTNEVQSPVDTRSIDEVSESSRLNGERLNTSVESCQAFRPGSRQPFYANAPPKPRRLNSSYEHSSTPDRTPERDRREFPEQTSHLYNPPTCEEDQTKPVPPPPLPESSRKAQYYPSSSERRTPEAYGATSTVGRGDYEDVYGGSYESTQHNNVPSRQRESVSSSRSGGTRLLDELNSSGYSQGTNPPSSQRRDDSLPRNWQQFSSKPVGPPRPHSADFLEYDRRHGPSEMFSQRRGSGGDILVTHPQEQRPKSSVGYYHEGDFWSEENYATKMRESAIYKSYLQNGMRYSDHQNHITRTTPVSFNHSSHQHSHPSQLQHSPQLLPVGQRVPPAGAATPDLYMPQTAITPQKSPNSSHNQTGSLKRGLDPRYSQQEDIWSRGNQNSPNLKPNVGHPNANSHIFLRSASARLSRNNHPDDSHNSSFQEDGPENEKKMQQREESMKRLLEWKQRMLQSPLTRKSSSRPDSSASSSSSNKLNGPHNTGFSSSQSPFDSEFYRQQVLQELTSQELRTQMQVEGRIASEASSAQRSVLKNPPTKDLSSPFERHCDRERHSQERFNPEKYHQEREQFERHGQERFQQDRYNQERSHPERFSHERYAPPEKVSGEMHQQERLSQEMHSQDNFAQEKRQQDKVFQERLKSEKQQTERYQHGERPNPQGGSVETNDFSGINLNGSRRREARREASRTRHVSGGDSKRSASSSSRYNSYSSDEQDVIEERSTRRKTRKNSRRNNSDQKSDSRRQNNSASKTKANSSAKSSSDTGVRNNEENNVTSESADGASRQSHDYVNINSISGSDSNKSSSTTLRTPIIESNNYTGSQRAIPVFIDDQEECTKKTKPKNSVYNDKFCASRDPSYVSEVQTSLKPESATDGKSPVVADISQDSLQRTSNTLPEPEYENTFVQHISNHQTDPPYFQVSQENQKDNYLSSSNSVKHNKSNINSEQVYEHSSGESHIEHRVESVYPVHYQKTVFQDDNSIGKYSDSGYDTLRADISQKNEERSNSKGLCAEKGNDHSGNNLTKRINTNLPRRPETWSPDKFDRTWSHLDHDSKVDESEIVKEYSYEYITPEKNLEPPQSNLKQINVHLKLSTPNLPLLESPRIVQETQHATNRNLVKDRIKCFSSISEQNKPLEKMYADLDLVDQSNGIEKQVHRNDSAHDGPLKDPLNVISPGSRSCEAHVSNLKENFVSPLSTKIYTQEAQVKVLSDNQSTNELINKFSPSNSINSCSELSSLEYRDVKSPQEIMDSRLNRSNIRKFVFDEDAPSPQNIQEASQLVKGNGFTENDKKSVKELLKNFENKVEECNEFNFSRSDCKRKFHSDSELLSNESSSDESLNENVLNERLPPPPPSFLQELREEANKTEDSDMNALELPPRPPKKPTFGGEIDSRGRPRSLRLSLAESIEESLRFKSESENEENNWYGLPVKKSEDNLISKEPKPNRNIVNSLENDNTLIIDIDRPPRVHAPPPPKLPPDSFGQTNAFEENYLPMSPPKKTNKVNTNIVPSSSSSSLSSKHLTTPEPMYPDHFGKTEFEEHTYIEMTGEPSPKPMFSLKYLNDLPKLDVSKGGDEICLSPESPRYYEIGEKEGQHYEYIYKTGPQYEAIYMEVPNSGKDMSNEEQKPKPPQKPHDLKHMKPFHKKCSSDSALPSASKSKSNRTSDGSSDADDEASKDFDSIEPPRKPRFSLSDTFRPASYYLSGADPSTDLDAHDSSDSDLVSPPPIPLSAPPIDDINPSDCLRSKRFSPFDSKGASNSPVQSLCLNSSSPQLQKLGSALDQDLKRMSQPFYHKRSESGSSISSLSNKIKRRPLLEEILDEYNDDESFILRSEDIYPTSVSYPEDKSGNISDKSSPWCKRSSKENSEISLLPEDQHDSFMRPNSSMSLNASFHNRHDTSYSSGRNEESLRESIYENSHIQHSSSAGAIAGGPYVNLPSNSKINLSRGTDSPYSRELQRSFAQSPEVNMPTQSAIVHKSVSHLSSPLMFTNDRMSNESREGTLSPLQRNFVSPPTHQRSSSELSIRSLGSPVNLISGVSSPVHVRGSSNLSMSSETSPRTAPYYYSDVIRDENIPFPDESAPLARARSYQLNNQRELEGNKRQDIGRKVNQISTSSVPPDAKYRERLHNELKHSFELFDGKTISVPDERNVYEADTLRKMKSRIRTPDPEQNSKNIYPYGISIKMDDSRDMNPPSHRRTRSLEGLVEESVPRQRKPIREIMDRNSGHVNDNKFSVPPDGIPNSTTLSEVPPRSESYPSERNVSSPQPYPNPLFNHSTPRYNPNNVNFHSKGYLPPLPTPSERELSESFPEASTSHLLNNSIQNNSSQYPGHHEQPETRDGSASRMSLHDTFSIASGEANNWEDDGHWKEQLRRASLRHTRSLETLDDSRSRNSTEGTPNSMNDARPAMKLSLPNNPDNPHNIAQREERVRTPQRSLDEYHVDYREGRIPPGSHYSHNETLDRARKGLTSLEEYEWDVNEEKFRKPYQASAETPSKTPSKTSTMNNQPFLVDGLPPSSEMDQEETTSCKNSHMPSAGGQSSSPHHSIDMHDEGESELISRNGGRPTQGMDTFVRSNTPDWESQKKHQIDSAEETQGASSVNTKSELINTASAPDLIPEQDVNKLGENLHRRSDYKNPKVSSKYSTGDSPLSSYSYGFGNTYPPNPINPSTGQPYHQVQPPSYNQYNRQYKNDELSKYSNFHHQSPQHQYRYSNVDHGYQAQPIPNYRNQYDYNTYPNSTSSMERVNGMSYHRPVSQHQIQDQYSNFSNFSRNSEYYDHAFREAERLREEEMLLRQESAYMHPFAESELTVAKPSPPGPPPHHLPEESLAPSRNFLAGVSAGELLGKTHEELVLLLIQLRRHQSALLAARKHTALERDSQARLAHLDEERTDEHIQRISYLEEHLQDLDKQYQMGKPLINLVDNMVKLGSLYRGFDSRNGRPTGDPRIPPYQSPRQESLEFSRRILERRILAEDRREYDSVSPDQIDLEEKVMQLYKLEKRLQDESLTIQGLQKTKDMLEKTLEALHSRANSTTESMMELERRNRQKDHLERELSRLRSHLAVSARRLEETATENSRLEHEMMMLRQKIQTNMVRNAQRENEGSSEARHIESEMLRVQSLLEDLQKRRLELSEQIQRLTSSNAGTVERRSSPVGVPQGNSSHLSRRRNSTWLETDLDTLVTRDRGCDPPENTRIPTGGRQRSPYPYSSDRYSGRESNMSNYDKGNELEDIDYSQATTSELLQSSRSSPKMYSDNHYLSAMDKDLPVLTLSQTNLMEEELHVNPSGGYGSYSGLDHMRDAKDEERSPTMDRDAFDNKPDGEEQRSSPLHLDINEADDRVKRYYGILPKEKLLEPKTVRIVKRESTERKKDRYPPGKKATFGGDNSSLSHVAEGEMESDQSDIENEPPPMPDYSNRSTSLPRNYGRAGPSERISMMSAIARQNPAPTSISMSRPSNLPLRNKQGAWKSRNEPQRDRPMSAHEQLFGIPRGDLDQSPPSSPTKSDPPSPVFKSAAAREIIKEMAWEAEKHRRTVPKEKRRHFTISSSKPLSLETGSGLEEGARSRDDCDMVRALRPRNHPDVVKSTLSTRDVRFNESTIDTILGAPRKIFIPERYMPDEDDEKELTAEEKKHRQEKALAIRKMLTESSATVTKSEPAEDSEGREDEGEASSSCKSKIEAEKKEREHILAMNQILAKQVMEKSRIVAARALNEGKTSSSSEDDLSPLQSPPYVQQRENFLV